MIFKDIKLFQNGIQQIQKRRWVTKKLNTLTVKGQGREVCLQHMAKTIPVKMLDAPL